MKLRDLFNPDDRLLVCELRSILKHLPPESAFKTALRNDTPVGDAPGEYAAERDPWSKVEMLLADVVDRVAELTYITMRASGNLKAPPGGWDTLKPKPLRRPGWKPEEKKRAPLTPAAAERLFKMMNPEGTDDGC